MQGIKFEIKKMLADKRRTQRLGISLRVRYRLLSPQIVKRNIWQETFSHDISGGGMRLRLGFPLKKGDRLEALIYFPNDVRPVNVVMETIWCKRMQLEKRKIFFDIGLQYLQINARDKERFIMLFCEMMVDYFVLSDKEKYQKNEKNWRRQYVKAEE